MFLTLIHILMQKNDAFPTDPSGRLAELLRLLEETRDLRVEAELETESLRLAEKILEIEIKKILNETEGN